MRRTPNNASGKYLNMNEAETAREQARFERAVQRQHEKDAAAAARAKALYGKKAQ